MKRPWMAAVLVLTALVALTVSGCTQPSLAEQRFTEAYESAVNRFGLNPEDWDLLSLKNFATREGLERVAFSSTARAPTLDVALHDALTLYHHGAQVFPPILLSRDGRTVLVCLWDIYEKTVCLVRLGFDDAAGWTITEVGKR